MDEFYQNKIRFNKTPTRGRFFSKNSLKKHEREGESDTHNIHE